MPSPNRIETLIAQLPEALRQLAARGVVKHYRKNQHILEEGESGDTLYILLEGKVTAFSADISDRRITYATDRAGDYFGEMSLDGGRRSASVIAVEPTLCAVVTGHTVWQFVESSPAFGRELITKLIGRARWATERARELAFLNVYERVRRLLENLAGPPDAQGVRRIGERLTHLAIAEKVGSSREMVSRIMKDLERGGVLDTEDALLVLLKKIPERW